MIPPAVKCDRVGRPAQEDQPLTTPDVSNTQPRSPFPRHLVLRFAAQMGSAAAERAWRERLDRQRGAMLFHPVAALLLAAAALFLLALAAGMMP